MEEVFESTGAIDKTALKSLAERSDLRGLVRLASHLAAILCTGVLLSTAWGSAWLLPALVLHGVALAFLFAPLHETVHSTAFRSRALNRVVGFFCGFVLFLPSEYFRAFHFAHHRYTQDESADPELARPKPESLGEYLVALSGYIYWCEQAALFARLAAGRVEEAFVPERRRQAVIWEARLLLVLYALIALASLDLGSAAALTYWLLPLALGQPALRAFLMAEHTGCALGPDMLRNSRTTLSNPFVRWLAWNMNYHVEHHAYPALPFHALPKAHGLIRDKIAVRAPGYLAVHWGFLRRFLSEAA